MSVTFAPTFATSDIIGHIVVCAGDLAWSTAPVDYVEAHAQKLIHDDSCPKEYCRYDGGTVEAVERADVAAVGNLNVNNRNAIDVLRALGLEANYDDLSGQIDATDLLGRLLVALAVQPVDQGIDTRASSTSGATIIECGRPDGYLHSRFEELTVIARRAAAIGRTVTWA